MYYQLFKKGPQKAEGQAVFQSSPILSFYMIMQKLIPCFIWSLNESRVNKKCFCDWGYLHWSSCCDRYFTCHLTPFTLQCKPQLFLWGTPKAVIQQITAMSQNAARPCMSLSFFVLFYDKILQWERELPLYCVNLVPPTSQKSVSCLRKFIKGWWVQGRLYSTASVEALRWGLSQAGNHFAFVTFTVVFFKKKKPWTPAAGSIRELS